MGNKYTEAQKKATMKYLQDKTDDIRIRTPKGTKDKWKEAAAKKDKSLNQFIFDTIEREIKEG
jgi:predicted HicB family RNase H-like nuclease